MFEPLKIVVNRVLAGKGQAQTFSAAETCGLTERIIASELPELANRFRAKFVKNDTLYLAVDHSAVGQEIQLSSDLILSEIGKRFSRITKLRYSVEPIDPLEPC